MCAYGIWKSSYFDTAQFALANISFDPSSNPGAQGGVAETAQDPQEKPGLLTLCSVFIYLFILLSI